MPVSGGDHAHELIQPALRDRVRGAGAAAVRPLTDVVKYIDPPPAELLDGSRACSRACCRAHDRHDEIHTRQSMLVTSRSRLMTAPPVGAALPCRTVIGPSFRLGSATAARQASSSATSTPAAMARPPRCSISFATASAGVTGDVGYRNGGTVRAAPGPLRHRSRALPVTSATRPVRSGLSLRSLAILSAAGARDQQRCASAAGFHLAIKANLLLFA